MVMTLYDFPLPNNGDRYDLSPDELQKILDHVYKCGWDNARQAFDPACQGVTHRASTGDGKYYVFNQARWKLESEDKV